MRAREVFEWSLNILIFCGIAGIVIGLGSWTIGFLRRLEISWEFEAIFIGMLIIIFSFIAAKMLSRMN